MRPVLMVGFLVMAVAAQAAPRDDLLAADKAFSDLSIAKGAHAAFLATMTEDARIYEGDTPPLIGKAATAAYYAAQEQADPRYQSERLEWTPVEAVLSPDGMLGFTRGTWVFTAPGPAGKPFKRTGYYVTEWQRQSDGRYKFCLDIGGADKAK